MRPVNSPRSEGCVSASTIITSNGSTISLGATPGISSGVLSTSASAEVDVYWAATAGRDPVAEIEALGARVRRVHLKDGPAVLGEPQVALGEGRLDIEACARAARHADWYIVELDECATDMFDALAASYRYLDERGLGLTSPPSPALP